MAQKANLNMDQGATFSTVITLTDQDNNIINLSNYTGAAMMRKTFTSSNSHSFNVSLSNTSGTVTLSMSANTTANVSAGRYVYDLELTDGSSIVSRVLEGIVTVSPNVTR